MNSYKPIIFKYWSEIYYEALIRPKCHNNSDKIMRTESYYYSYFLDHHLLNANLCFSIYNRWGFALYCGHTIHDINIRFIKSKFFKRNEI